MVKYRTEKNSATSRIERMAGSPSIILTVASLNIMLLNNAVTSSTGYIPLEAERDC
jgi:hypothetical protein